MKKSEHTQKFESRMNTSGKNQDAVTKDLQKIEKWMSATQAACRTVGQQAKAMADTAKAAKVLDESYAATVVKMIQLEEKIAPMEKAKDKGSQDQVKALMKEYKGLDGTAGKTLKQMHARVDELKASWKAVQDASTIEQAV